MPSFMLVSDQRASAMSSSRRRGQAFEHKQLSTVTNLGSVLTISLLCCTHQLIGLRKTSPMNENDGN